MDPTCPHVGARLGPDPTEDKLVSRETAMATPASMAPTDQCKNQLSNSNHAWWGRIQDGSSQNIYGLWSGESGPPGDHHPT